MKKYINLVTLNFIRRNFDLNLFPDLNDENIDSVKVANTILGAPAPLIVLEEIWESKKKKTNYNILTGKNFIYSIIKYFSGDYPLIISDESKTFNDIDNELAEKILETEVVMYVYRDLDNKEKEFLLSNIKKVSNIKERNTEINTEPKYRSLKEYLNHPFFEKVNVNQLDEDIVASMLMVKPDGIDFDLSAKKIAEFKEGLREIPNITKELDYLNEAFFNREIYLKKINLPMIFICAQKAITDKVNHKDFKVIIDNFFNSNNLEYKKACDSGTSSKSNVNKRIIIMWEFYNKSI